jgi:hypothetical protein
MAAEPRPRYVPSLGPAGLTVVCFSGPTLLLGVEDPQGLAAELATLAGRSGLRLDLRHVDFVNAATLGLLRGLRVRLRATGRRLRLCHVRPDVAAALAAGSRHGPTRPG